MTTALGIERESFLVTEELVGFDPIESVAWGRISPALRALLRKLSERRVAVPDLYAKHVFLRKESLRPETIDFAVVDLPRVETRSLRSAIELFVRHAGALVATVPGATARELAPAFPGGGAHVERRIEERAALVRKRKKIDAGREALPYPGRSHYIGEQPVARYRARSVRRDRAEVALLETLLPERIEGFALDAPSGHGRMSEVLRARGGKPVSFDISPDMARAALATSGRAAVAELEHLPLADRSVDLAVCFRFLHHVPTRAQRVGILKELARVSRRYVVLTWFHPVSLHHLRRLFARDSMRFALTRRQIVDEASEAGLSLDASRAQLPYLRDLWLARFKVP
jgi:hypothetical protein